MSNLVNEILLRLAKALAATVIAMLIFAVMVGPMGRPGSVELALLAWLSGAAFILLVETSPL